MKKTGLFLSLGFSLVLGLMVVVFTVALNRMGDNQAHLQQVMHLHFEKADLINIMYSASRERSIKLFEMVTLVDPFDRDEKYLRFNELGGRFAQARIRFIGLALDPEERRLLDAQAAHTSVVRPTQEQIVELMNNDRLDEATSLLLDKAVPRQNMVLGELQRMIDHQQQSVRAAFETADAMYEDTKRSLGALILVALGFGVLIAFYVVRKTNSSERALIEANENLERRVAERTSELSNAYEDLKKSQKQLLQSEKMASLGQLTAGIAHEIKNPLNFINNFAETSAGLAQELKEEVARAHETPDRADWSNLSEIAEMLNADMTTITDHGNRIDAIIQGMLLHARGGSGDWSKVDLNALIEQTLALAYHGERARNRSFSIQLDTRLDPAVGQVELVSQDISRMLVNLFANAFYATQQRQRGNDNYKPCIGVETRAQDGKVEIRISDNGTGIPDTVRDQLFTPFFTTKPTGEGTGLGLSISYDIVVDQHNGQIHVESEQGTGTTFAIELPRTAIQR